MKRFFLLASLILLFSVVALAQSPTSVTSPNTSATSPQVSPAPSMSPTPAASTGPPNLPYMVEILACVVMVGSVLTVFLLVRRQQELRQQSIGPRHIQFVSVCLIVPTILILGLEQVLSKETTATLIGGLTGYLLSGLGKYEPPKHNGGGEEPKPPEFSSGRGGLSTNDTSKKGNAPPQPELEPQPVIFQPRQRAKVDAASYDFPQESAGT